MVMGDLNARTGEDPDLIHNDVYDQNIPLFENYLPDSCIIDRYSKDKVVLARGRALNDLCIQTGLRILNGRSTGDLVGNFTCHNYNGSSVVDYGIVSETLLSRINIFKIHKFNPDLD